jgi:demethylmenaquinone methyltransferase/2-methoxy-6-polyprenyl-1,4-benzoquinol methylase
MSTDDPGRGVPFGYRDVDAREKSGLVRDVFDRVASRYDLMNDVMSGGVHRLWKQALMDWLDPQPGQTLLDVAGGTGDVGRAFLARARDKARRRGCQEKPGVQQPETRAILCDINEAMLRAGAARNTEERAEAGIQRLCGDAEALPLADRTVEACTIAFGIRNVTHIDRALAEMRRVLKPGGRFLCLEFSHVDAPGLDALYETYSFKVIPQLGRVLAGSAEPYRYLVESIRRFPSRDEFAGLMGQAGFAQIKVRPLSGGIAALHSGWRI